MRERIKKLRKILKLTQQEFANRIGMKRNTVANYETGRNDPSASVISLICLEFNVNESWLRNGNGDMFTTPAQSVPKNQAAPVATTGNKKILIEVELPAYMDPDFMTVLSQLSPELLSQVKGYADGLLQAKIKADGKPVSPETT